MMEFGRMENFGIDPYFQSMRLG